MTDSRSCMKLREKVVGESCGHAILADIPFRVLYQLALHARSSVSVFRNLAKMSGSTIEKIDMSLGTIFY